MARVGHERAVVISREGVDHTAIMAQSYNTHSEFKTVVTNLESKKM